MLSRYLRAAAIVIAAFLVLVQARPTTAQEPMPRLPPDPPPTPTIAPPTTPTPAQTPIGPPATPPPLPGPTAVPILPSVLPTPPPVNPEGSIPVVIEYGGGQQTTAIIYAGVMEPVGVPRAQSVTVTLFLPAAYAGQIMRIGLYDGGHAGAAAPPGSEMVASQAFEVRTDGIVQFNFKAGQTLGLYRVLATIGADQHLLQFYAVTPRPSSGSPAATEVNGPIVSPTVDPLPTPSGTPTPPDVTPRPTTPPY